MQPDNFEDISAPLALYRPGPMGANSHTTTRCARRPPPGDQPIHPELAEPLAEILGETYGLIVYQEQVHGDRPEVAGYTLGKADMLRRAMGKKKKEILDAEFVPFRGACWNGYSEQAIKTAVGHPRPVLRLRLQQGAHRGVRLVSYWTAYLKANYPAEYMAALLTSVRDDKDKSALYLNECRRMGIKVLPPDVNESIGHFAAVGERHPVRAEADPQRRGQRRRGDRRTRARQGEFTSFEDFLQQGAPPSCATSAPSSR
jgi:DNA polymerase-3 subunit alpha